MRLKSLTLKGFKSFSEKKDIIFGDKIVAVVGPNGSGKSNITESFRFVLGEQSMKILRSKKGENLIYHGHKNLSSHNNASVKIVFNNNDNFFPTVSFDELVLERTVYKNGENEYKLNNTPVRLKDVLEILASVNIGPTGHHIISQGGADRILNSNPEERKEMIEDGLGLKHLQYKKNDSEKKIKKTLENINKVSGLIREVKIHLSFLEKQVSKHRRAEKLKEELIKAYKHYFSIQKTYTTYWTTQYDNKYKELQILDNEFSLKIKDSRLNKEFTEIIHEYKEKHNEIENKLSELRIKKDKISRELGRLEGKKEHENSLLDGSDFNNAYVKAEEISKAHKEVFDIIDSHKNTTDIDEFKKSFILIKNILVNLLEKEDVNKENLQEKNANIDTEIEKKNSEIVDIEKEELILQEELKAIQKLQDSVIENTQIKEKQMVDLFAQKNKNDRDISDCSRNKDQIKRDMFEYDQEKNECKALVGLTYDFLISDSTENELLDREKIISFKKNLERLKIRLEEIGVGLDESTLEEYNSTKERYDFLQKEIFDLKESIIILKDTISRLQKEIDEKFKKGISSINKEFEKLFNILFGGGTASIKLIKTQKKIKDDEDIEQKFEEKMGIDIAISLPQKKVKELEQLSGGERSLVSIALLFSLSQITPPAFMVLDETDAALDEANSKKYGDMLEVMSEKTQLVVVTHNRETMSRANVIYGISMDQNGSSTLLSVRFEDAVKIAK